MRTVRFLVTGAAGFIGAHFMRSFLREDREFVLVDRLNYAGSLQRLHGLSMGRNVTFLYHDLRAPLTDFMVANIGQVDYVVHMAAETHVDRSLTDPLPFLESNVVGTYNMLEYCRRHQRSLTAFYYVSTDEVYGPAPDGIDHDEDQPHRPSNPYSAMKAAAEDLCYAWEHSMGVPVVITNTMNNIGEMQHPEKFVPKCIAALFEKQVITVHGTPDDPGSRKYLYAWDHADALAFLMEHGRRGERYNVVGTEEISNLDMVRRLERITGLEARIKFVDFHSTRPGHDKRYSLDGGRMAGMGWTPTAAIDDVLRGMCAFYLAREDWR